MHPARADEASHAENLLVLVPQHLLYHVLDLAEARRFGVESHDLPEPPGCAFQRGTPLAGDCREQPPILMGSARAVASRQSADIRMRFVEATVGASTENVPLEEDPRAPVWKEL